MTLKQELSQFVKSPFGYISQTNMSWLEKSGVCNSDTIFATKISSTLDGRAREVNACVKHDALIWAKDNDKRLFANYCRDRDEYNQKYLEVEGTLPSNNFNWNIYFNYVRRNMVFAGILSSYINAKEIEVI